jgi:hypothetical protein
MASAYQGVTNDRDYHRGTETQSGTFEPVRESVAGSTVVADMHDFLTQRTRSSSIAKSAKTIAIIELAMQTSVASAPSGVVPTVAVWDRVDLGLGDTSNHL